MAVRRWQSPNHTGRRNGHVPSLVLIHYTAMPDAESACRRLCAPEHEVSAHWLIGRDGTRHALVDEERRAWHAGAGSWRGQGDVNSRSIGIELDNDGRSPFAAPLMDDLEEVLAGILERWAIPPEGVIAHSDIAPARKSDPGRRFDWRRLARGGLAVWPDLSPLPDGRVSVADFDAALTTIGYPEASPEARLHAFRLRFRPMAHGPLTAADLAAARDLAGRFGVDATARRA